MDSKVLTGRQLAEIHAKHKAAETPASRSERIARINREYRQGGSLRLAATQSEAITVYSFYEGISRRVLREEIVDSTAHVFPALTTLPQAVAMSYANGQVTIQHIKGDAIIPHYDWVSAEWEVNRGDEALIGQELLDYAQTITGQQIAKKEDLLLYAGLDQALSLASSEDGFTDNNVVTTNQYFQLNDWVNGQRYLKAKQTDPTNAIMNAGDMYDLYRWDISTAGLEVRDAMSAGQKVTQFGGITILSGVTVPVGVMYMTASQDQLGWFASRYGLQMEDDPSGVSKMKIRKIASELISEVILNYRGVYKVTKSNVASA